MKHFIASILILITFAGCQNFSPRQKQEIDNRDGKINGQIDTMANSVKAELLKLQQNDEIHAQSIDRLQKGMVNMQSNYQNSGVQILSGPGGLIFSLVALLGGIAIALHYRKNSIMSEKASQILAQKIAERDDENLNEEIFKAAMYTDVEKKIYNLMKKKD